MKLKTSIALSVVSALFLTAGANALPLIDGYVGATIGVGGITAFDSGDNRGNSAQSYGLALGIDVPIVRIEATYDYLNSDLGELHAGFINGYLKMPTPMVSPYIGAGIGNIFNGTVNELDIDTTTAYQAMLGVTFNVPVLPIKVDAEARTVYSPNVYRVANVDPDLLHYDLRLKLRYIF